MNPLGKYKPFLLLGLAACCAAPSLSWSHARAAEPPEKLTQVEVEDVMKSQVKPKAATCAAKEQGRAPGLVVIAGKVSPTGNVVSSSVAENDGIAPAVASCVATAVRNARFPETKKGGAFTYPFRF